MKQIFRLEMVVAEEDADRATGSTSKSVRMRSSRVSSSAAWAWERLGDVSSGDSGEHRESDMDVPCKGEYKGFDKLVTIPAF